MKKVSNVLWGGILILIGLIIGGNALGITNINIFFDGWWTLFIIIPSFIGLFKEEGKTGNIIGLLIGILLLLSCQDILDFNMIWKLALPVILVIIGLSLIFKDTVNGKINEEIKKLNKNKTQENEYCSTFSGQNIKFNQEKFNGADVTAIFGGIDLDLTNAIIEGDTVINVSSIFGGVDIHTPNNIKIKVKSSSIFGGVSNKKKNPEEGEQANTIYINANCIFGGVDIK